MNHARGFRCWAVGALMLAAAAAAWGQPGSSPAPSRSETIRLGAAVQPSTAQAAVYDLNLNVKQAIDEAVARAGADNRRVIVVWGSAKDPWSARLRDQFAMLDAARIIKYHYEVVWAEIADPTAGPLNMAVARIYGAQPDPARKPMLTIIHTAGEAAGKQLVSEPTDGWEDPRKARSTSPDYALYKVHQFLLSHKPPAIKAGQVIDQANSRAREQSKPLLMNFIEPFEPWCIKFKAWAERPEVAAILGKHFVVSWIDLERMDGAEQAFNRYGGEHAETLPWFIFLDMDGRRLAPEPGTPGHKEVNLGFPTGDEVAQFARFIKQAAPGVSDAELKVLQDTLKASAEPEKPSAGTP